MRHASHDTFSKTHQISNRFSRGQKVACIQSITLSLNVTPIVQRLLLSAKTNTLLSAAFLPIGNFLAVQHVLGSDCESRANQWKLSSDARDQLEGLACRKGADIILHTPHGNVQLNVEDLQCRASAMSHSSNESGMFTDVEKVNIQLLLKSDACESSHKIEGFTSESVLLQISSDLLANSTFTRTIELLCATVTEHYFPEALYPGIDVQPTPAQRFLSMAFVGTPGSGKTFGVQQIATFLQQISSLSPKVLNNNSIDFERIPIVVHITIEDIIPHDDTLGIHEHLDMLDEGLKRIFRTCRAAMSYFLVFDGLAELFAQRYISESEAESQTDDPPYFYHPFVKNFLIHSIDRFLDEERSSASEAWRGCLFVFRDHLEIPERLCGHHKILYVYGMESTQVPDDNVNMFYKLCESIGYTHILQKDIGFCAPKSKSFHRKTEHIQQCSHFSDEIRGNATFLHQRLEKMCGLSCFCCYCTQLKERCGDLTQCCTSEKGNNKEPFLCCWVCRIAQLTKGWSLLELTSLLRFSTKSCVLDVRKAAQYAIDFQPQAMQCISYSHNAKSSIADENSSSRSIDFYDESNAWDVLQDILSRPLQSVVTNKPGASASDIPKGILIHGRSGCGKTTLLTAIEHHLKSTQSNIDYSSCADVFAVTTHLSTGINILRIDATQIISKFVGESEMNLASVFRQARRLEPCVILADHVEQIIGVRRDRDNAANYEERLLTTFLTEMSGLYTDPKTSRVLVFIGATHYPLEAIDPAALRAGRFDVHLRLDCAMNAENVISVLQKCVQKVPSKLSSEALCKTAQHLVSRKAFDGVVIADIVQAVHQMVWKAILRNSTLVEDCDAY